MVATKIPHFWQIPCDTKERRLERILELVPPNVNQPYDMRQLIEMLVDDGNALELQSRYGGSIVTTLARLGGEPVFILANQPMVLAGAINREAAEKAAHFLELADSFHFPVVFLADNPGIMAGTKAERDGTLRAAARMYAAQARLRTPKLHVTLRKAFGFGKGLILGPLLISPFFVGCLIIESSMINDLGCFVFGKDIFRSLGPNRW